MILAAVGSRPHFSCLTFDLKLAPTFKCGDKKKWPLAPLLRISLELCSLTLFHDIFGIEYLLLSIKNDCTLCLDTFGYFFFHVP